MSLPVCRTTIRKSFHTLQAQPPRARSGSSGQVIWIAKFRPLFSKGRHGLTLQATMTTVLYGSVLGNRFGGSSIADSAIYPVVHGRGRETHVNEVDPIGSGLIKRINRPGANITRLIFGNKLLISQQQGEEITALEIADHSITSSARTRIDAGTVRPRTFCRLALRPITNLVGN